MTYKERVSHLNNKLHEDGRKYIKESILKMGGVLNKIIDFKQKKAKPEVDKF